MGERRRRILAERKRLGQDAATLQPFLHRLKRSCAITAQSPKTAALIFEKISAPMELIESAPLELVTYGSGKRLHSLPAYHAGGPAPEERTVKFQIRDGALVGAPTREGMLYALNKVPDQICQRIEDVGFRPILCYPNFSSDMEAFKAGDYRFVLACISGLGVIDEEKLTWDQVLEFRKDEDSRLSVARFLNWLNLDMNGKSKAQIQDELAQMCERHSTALQKFGVYLSHVGEALFGVSEDRLKNIASLAGAATTAGSVAVDPFAATVFGGFTVGQGLWFGIRRAHAKLGRQHDATAFFYGLRKLQASQAAQESGVFRLSSDDEWTY